jgi:hypothetical protein
MTDMEILKYQIMLSTLASICEVESNPSLTSDVFQAAIIKRDTELYLKFKEKNESIVLLNKMNSISFF